MTLNRFFMYALFTYHCFGMCLTCTESWSMTFCIVSNEVWMTWLMNLSMYHVFYNLYSFVLKTLTAPLGVKISDTSHCFVFVSWCLCFCLGAFIGSLNLLLFLFVANLQFLLYEFLRILFLRIPFVLHVMGSQQWEYVHRASRMWVFSLLAFQLICLRLSQVISGLYNLL